MGLFDALQNLIGGASEAAQGSLQDIVGNVADPQVLQDIQEQITGATEGVSDIAGTAGEQAQQVVDDITQNLSQ